MLGLQNSTYEQLYSLGKTLLTMRNKERLGLGLVTRKFRRMGQVLGLSVKCKGRTLRSSTSVFY